MIIIKINVNKNSIDNIHLYIILKLLNYNDINVYNPYIKHKLNINYFYVI